MPRLEVKHHVRMRSNFQCWGRYFNADKTHRIRTYHYKILSLAKKNYLPAILISLLIALPLALIYFFPQQTRQLVAQGAASLLRIIHERSTQVSPANQTPVPPPAVTPGHIEPPPGETPVASPEETPAVSTIFGLPVPPFFQPKPPPIKLPHIGPVQFSKKTLYSCPLFESVVQLQDADTFLDIGLPGAANRANDAVTTYGDEPFEEFVKRCRGAVVANGTFFSKDDQKRVMGNMVAAGEFLKYSQWENYGTTFGLRSGNKPEMITARDEGQPAWENYWFSITCGPRLLKHGQTWVYPEVEGFADSHVLGVGPRTAIGFSQAGDKLYLVTFVNGLSLPQEAHIMKELGCYEAMNMDGGASRALAHNGTIVMKAGRSLTNVIVVYDSLHRAPDGLRRSWLRFQDGNHPTPPR